MVVMIDLQSGRQYTYTSRQPESQNIITLYITVYTLQLALVYNMCCRAYVNHCTLPIVNQLILNPIGVAYVDANMFMIIVKAIYSCVPVSVVCLHLLLV